MAKPQTLLPESAFLVTHSVDGLPEVKIHSVSEIVARWEGTAVSSTKSRSGKENHQTRDPGKAEFPPVTFSCHGNKDETKKVWDTFDKCGKGNPLRGAITVQVTNPKDNYSVVLQCHLHDLTLLSYNPFAGVDVDNPDTLTFEFTVTPDRIEFKK